MTFSLSDPAFLRVGQPTGSTMIVHDTFTYTVSDLAGSTPDTVNNGNVWEVLVAGFQTNGSVASATTNTTPNLAVIQCGTANCTVEASIPAASSTNRRHGVAFRVVDSSNYWRFVMFQDGTNQKWELIRTSGGTPTTVASNTAYRAAGYGQMGIVRVVLSGDSITAINEYNGTPDTVYSGTSTVHNTATKHGLVATNSASGAQIDNFKVYT